MVSLHGLFNAFGFIVAGLLGHLRLAQVERLP